jgi:hypothetical protein
VLPVCAGALGIALLALSLLPSFRPTNLTISLSVEYMSLWVLVGAEVSLVVLAVWLRARQLHLAPPPWRPGEPQRGRRGSRSWGLLGWAPALFVVANATLVLHLSGGLSII